jgi:hypothetical protein
MWCSCPQQTYQSKQAIDGRSDFVVGYAYSYLQSSGGDWLWTTVSGEAHDLVNRTPCSGYPASHPEKLS